MATRNVKSNRLPLSRDRVLEAAVALADEAGIEAVTMRALADELGVEAMSLYYYVANKEALLDGVAEVVVGQINQSVVDLGPATGPGDWKTAMRERILRARGVMLQHPWAPAILETRTSINPAALVYVHGLLEIFRVGGVSYDLAHHAMHALGSRAFGFSQEMFDPAPGSDDEDLNEENMEAMRSQLPLLFEMLEEISHDDPGSTIGWCDDQTEFEFALDILLDGLEARRTLM